MKKLMLSLLLFTAFGCWGPEMGEGTTYVYTVINESGVPIKIKSYISYYPNVEPKITTLYKGEVLTKKYKDYLPPGGYSFKRFFGESRQRDSILVIYGSEKYAVFTDDYKDGLGLDDKRNPLNFLIYNDVEETFIFTKEDYQNAQDCNGQCD